MTTPQPIAYWERPDILLRVSGGCLLAFVASAFIVRIVAIPDVVGVPLFIVLMAAIPTTVLLAAYSAAVRPSRLVFMGAAACCFSVLPLAASSVTPAPSPLLDYVVSVLAVGAGVGTLWVVVQTVLQGGVRLTVGLVNHRFARAGQPLLRVRCERWWRAARAEARCGVAVAFFGFVWIAAGWWLDSIPDSGSGFELVHQAASRVVDDGKPIAQSLVGLGLAAVVLGIVRRDEDPSPPAESRPKGPDVGF